MFKNIISLTVLSLFLFGCSTGISPIKNSQMNGSISKERRLDLDSSYHEVVIGSARTNIIGVKVIESNKVLATIPVQIITPEQKKIIQIQQDIKKKNHFWRDVGLYFIVILIIYVVAAHMFGFKNIINFFVAPFKKEDKKTVDNKE